MKHITKALLVLFAMVIPSLLSAQSKDEMEAWMTYMTPGSVHNMLGNWDGEWTEETTFWMSPGSEPMTTKGNAVNKMILGGRYQHSTHTSNMMGMPFEGINILGYDNKRNVFQSVWIDNMGTGMMMMEGTWNDATKSCSMTGKTTDPMTGELMNVREVFSVVDDNTQKMEMFMEKDGKEFKSMEITWKRK